MVNIIKFLIIFLILIFPIKNYAAEILQINSGNHILVGDQNRNISIELFCVNVNEENEQNAINLLKNEFPRGIKVKIKPYGFKKDYLLAKVFDINGTKEMTELLISRNLTKETCKN